MPLSPGTRLGPYEILSPIGAGGMGEVYKAKDTRLDRTVAVKVLRETDPERLRRFEQEARSASALNHPNIVTIHDVGEHEGTPYIAMEYVDGATLREMLSGGPLPNDKLIRYATQMAEGLAKAHQAGIVHRDLKPENIIISDDGYVKILDFGLAKLSPERDEGAELSTLAKQTSPGAILGTVGYMSPEQAKGQPADFRSDQFSLGAIAYEMATGKRAFERDSAPQTLTAIIEAGPDPVTTLNPQVPGHMAAVIDRCLSKAPSDRYTSTSEIAKEFHQEGLVTPSQSSDRNPLAAVIGLGLLAIVLVMILGLYVPEIREWVLGAPACARIESIAVLPLENLSGDPEQEYFVDGMTEALIASLAKIPDLKVISRTSVMRFKGERLDIAEIAEQLGVEAIVEGSVLKADKQVRITAQLIDTRSDEHLWAESYEGDLADVLRLQDDVSVEIAQEVRRTLAPASPSTVDSIPPEAYDAYLRGRYFFNQRVLDDAIAHFQEAIRIAPDFAKAYAALATSYSSGRQVGLARAAVEKAMEIAPELPEAQTPLANVLRWEWRWSEAEEQYRKAIGVNPNDGHVRHTYSIFLSRLGRHDEAIAMQREALALDPLSPIVNAELGARYFNAGRSGDAVGYYERALAVDPSFGHTYAFLSLSLIELERYEEALEAAAKAERFGSFVIPPDFLVGSVYARMGREEEARHVLSDSDNPLLIAMILGDIGDLDAGFEQLEKAFDERNPDLNVIAHMPYFRPYRSDPRLQDLLRRMNFPE